jgi:hypothetical protein
MTLKKNDSGEPVKDLQRLLNRLGSLLTVDGDFGPTTEAAVADARMALKLPGPPQADDALIAALRGLPEPSADLTAAGVTFIGREEVSSPADYHQSFSHPVWPSAESGITIGIGYDLRFATEATLRADWGGAVPEAVIEALLPVLGRPGSPDRMTLVRHVQISLPSAMQVFLKRMLPAHTAQTRTTYPTLDSLLPARRTALISLVFNRGGGLAGDRRREMQRIRELLDAGITDGVAEQLDAMARLWDPQKENGIIKRRQREATLWRSGFTALQLE